MSEKRLDEIIDRVVRDMMRLDPRPGLSRRVLARLDQPRTRWPSVPRLAAATALLAVAVIAIVLGTRTPAPVSQQVSLNHSPAAPAPQTVVRVPPRSTDATPRVATKRAPRAVRQRHETPEDIPPFASGVQVQPLASIEPIALDRVGPMPIESPGVSIAPLAPIEPVRVDPLSSTPR
jgi:hypothetical protein